MFSAIGTRTSFLRPRDRVLPFGSVTHTVKPFDEKSVCISEYSDDNFQTNYGSLFEQLQEINDEAGDIFEYLGKSFDVLWHSLVMTLILFVVLLIPISMLIIGSSYRKECPVIPAMPYYLLIGGACGVFEVIILLWRQKRARKHNVSEFGFDDDYDDAIMARSALFTGYLFACALLSLLVVLNISVFSTWIPNFKQILHEPKNWCNETVYMYAYYLILTCHSFILIVLVCALVMCSVYVCSQYRTNNR